MESFAAWIAEIITNNARWASAVIGLLCFGESLVLVGLFIPATALMIATGSLLATGRLDPVWIVGAAIIGSVFGDWVSYLVGARLGPAAYRHWPLREHRTAVAQARLFFRRYGFFAVFAGRFLGPLRAIVPLVAGVTRMPSRSFQLANVASASLWVPTLFAPGYFSAKHFAADGNLSDGSMMFIGLGVGLGCAVGSWVYSKVSAARRRARKSYIREAASALCAGASD
ncbi:DedA family protein [Novosphingobium sp. G106]|uniref:DedA family protein n=1 Tax=Novosphingobium sp. G106 TaxID=2849500 RepID=UPI001C2CDACA|nr:DedA family protein [Novosphingobium sp. G106]MBV1692170.1 DedA family protein [Novosphingobium sp. G106]MBV1692439.1 DedA family protein [Novosphingobium sp. G106]